MRGITIDAWVKLVRLVIQVLPCKMVDVLRLCQGMQPTLGGQAVPHKVLKPRQAASMFLVCTCPASTGVWPAAHKLLTIMHCIIFQHCSTGLKSIDSTVITALVVLHPKVFCPTRIEPGSIGDAHRLFRIYLAGARMRSRLWTDSFRLCPHQAASGSHLW